MALISLFSRLVNGMERQVDLSTNTIVVQAIQINGTLLSATGGSTLVGDAGGYSNFTPAAATVRGALQGIDSALAGSGSTQLDGTFAIENTSDNTKVMKFDASGISAASTRTLKMADADVDLANLTNSNISGSAAIAYSKLSLTNSIVNADISSSAAIAYSKLALSNSVVNADIAAAAAIAYSKLAALGGSTNAVLIQNSSGFVAPSAILSTNLFLADGSVSATADLNLGAHKATNAADPTSPQDLATKFYVDNLVASLSWKTEARVASAGSNVSIASAPSSIDGVTLAANDRVLLKDQTAPAENGIYVFSAAASPLTRAPDMSTWQEVVGSVLLVTEGTVNTGSKWVNQNIAGGTLGTTAISFAAFSIAGTVNGTGTTNYVAYWSGAATITAEQFLSASRGGLAADVSAFTGVLKAVAGVFSASTIVNADVSGSAAIAYSKLNLSASIVNADISGSAAIAYSKLSLSNSIQLSDMTANSVDENKIVSTAFSASGAITGGSGSKIAWVPDNSSLEISSDAARIKTTAYDQKTITGGGGSAAAVQNAPAMVRTLVAGQTFTANTSYAVRWGLTTNGETAGRVYAADITTSSFDLFYVIGMASSAAGVSAGGNISVTSFGSFNLSSSDTAFASNTDGAPVFLTASGTFSVTPPSTSGQAVTRIGIVQVRSATNTSCIIDVDPAAVGVN